MQQELRKTEILWNDCRQVSLSYSIYQPNLSTACPLACTDTHEWWQGPWSPCSAAASHCHCQSTKSTFLHGPSPWARQLPAHTSQGTQVILTRPGLLLGQQEWWPEAEKEGSKGQKRLPIYRRRNLCEKWLNTCTDRCGGVQGSGFPHSLNSIF